MEISKETIDDLAATPLVVIAKQLEAELVWMRREIERVGHALYTGTETGYVGTEEDLHCIGQTVEGVIETMDKLEAENERLRELLGDLYTTDMFHNPAVTGGMGNVVHVTPDIQRRIEDALKNGE